MTPLEELNLYIKKHRLRHSLEREQVLEHIISIDSHFTAQSLYESLHRQSPISRMTVYNAIELFSTASIIVRHPFQGAEACYELRERAATHHHRICTVCGTIKEFTDQKFSKPINNRNFATFTTQYHSIYLYGVCSKCSNPKKQKTKRR